MVVFEEYELNEEPNTNGTNSEFLQTRSGFGCGGLCENGMLCGIICGSFVGAACGAGCHKG